MPRHFSPEQKSQLLLDLKQSGLSTSAFARQKGIPSSTIEYWIKRAKAQTTTFVEVLAPTTKPMEAPAPRLCLRVGSQIQLELPHLPDPRWLADLAGRLSC